MSTLFDAIRFLTIIPLPGGPGGPPGRASVWFPFVGFALGAALVVLNWFFGSFLSHALSALLTLALWEILTGGLHLDGLADSLDGFAGRDRPSAIRIMRDSRIGVFGTAGLILFFLLKGTALIDLTGPLRWQALLLAPAVGRATPLLLARSFRPATPNEGKGSDFMTSVTGWGLGIGLAVTLGGAGLLLWPWGLAVSVVGFTVAWAWGAFLARRLGGLTGDGLGGAVELAELAALLSAAALQHLKII